MNIERVAMDFSYREYFGSQSSADAYERLLLDAILGDRTLFIRRDETELAWDRVYAYPGGLETCRKSRPLKPGDDLRLPKYAAGTWGPVEADDYAERMTIATGAIPRQPCEQSAETCTDAHCRSLSGDSAHDNTPAMTARECIESGELYI